MRKINIPKETLEDLYVNKKMSSLKIAKALGVSKPVVLRRLKEFGIGRRNCSEARLPSGFSYPSAENFKQMYIEDCLTQQEIADKLGISGSVVSNILRKYNIPARNNSEAQRKRTNLEKLAEKEELERMYCKEGLSCEQIAEKLGISLSATNTRLKRHGISMRTPTDNIKYLEKEKKLLKTLYLDEKLSTPKIAKKLGIGVSCVGYRLKKYNIPIRDGSECHIGQEWSEEQREKMSERMKGDKNPGYGKPMSKEHLMKLIESRKDYPGKTRFSLNDTMFDSRDEAAVGSLFEKYIPGYEIKEGKTFQANGDTFCLFDFVLPEAIVEWHPIQIRYDASEEDKQAYRELRSEIRTREDRLAFNQLSKDYKGDLAVDYWFIRQDASDNSQIYQGKEVILARNFDELHNNVLSKYGADLPSKPNLKKEFESYRKQAKLVKKK